MITITYIDLEPLKFWKYTAIFNDKFHLKNTCKVLTNNCNVYKKETKMKYYSIYLLSTLILLFTACQNEGSKSTVSVTDEETGEVREEQAFTITNTADESVLIHGPLDKTFKAGECIKLSETAFSNLKITTTGPISQQKSICDKDCEPGNYNITKTKAEKKWYNFGEASDVFQTESAEFNDSDDCELHE